MATCKTCGHAMLTEWPHVHERCPTCGSDNPRVRRTIYRHMADDREGRKCPDKFHDAKEADDDGR